jgi:hypothetical protein
VTEAIVVLAAVIAAAGAWFLGRRGALDRSKAAQSKRQAETFERMDRATSDDPDPVSARERLRERKRTGDL